MAKKQGLTAALSLILALGLALSGCGGSGSQAQPPAAQSEDTEDDEQEGAEKGDGASEAPTGFTATQQDGITFLSMDEEASNQPYVKVRGIYVSGSSMSGTQYGKLVKLVQDTDLNAVVIDVKNDVGQITYPSAIPLVKEIQTDTESIIPNLTTRLRDLKSNGIYTIGRIVVFKDPYLAGKRPDYAIQKKGGGLWKDPSGSSWVDPYKEEVWNYNLAIAKEAVAMGFDEIQFDYLRFPDNAEKAEQEGAYRNPQGLSKMEAVQQFLVRGKEHLPNVKVSADVIGLTTSSMDDMGIGQKWEFIAPTVDVISPMIYPSRYPKGVYNLSDPETEPYNTVAGALQDALVKNQRILSNGLGSSTAKVRPWYQDFTITGEGSHKTYGLNEVRQQIRAGEAKGIEEFLLWNPSSEYSYK